MPTPAGRGSSGARRWATSAARTRTSSCRGRLDGPRLHLDRTDRTHLDLWAADEAEQRAEVERLQALGATRVEWDYPQDADFVVLSDPDGNLFCVVNTDG